VSTQSEKELNRADSLPNAALVREQLRRLLAHPLFSNSKRYPVLLAHTVEQSLDGNSDGLKERTIGVEAFGREPDYDVNLDPVVRTTAAEVRRRLIQYYYSPDHAGELIIELPVGSYVPLFREQVSPQTAVASDADPLGKSTDAAGIPPVEIKSFLALGPRHWMWIAIAVLGAAVAGYSVGRVNLPIQRSMLERFWDPITASASRSTYCIGEPKEALERRQNATMENPPGGLNLSDVTTLARSISPVVPRKGTFRVLSALETSFTQLREGPFVLIGAFNNPWTLRITQDLPLGFELNGQERKIVDRKNPARSWEVQRPAPNMELAVDYAIVGRFHDNITGQPVIVLAGILAEGTEAAGEVVSSPEYLKSMLEKIPNWDQKNLEAVIETHVIDGHPGPPTVVAIETW
jgi:hypothetical protein